MVIYNYDIIDFGCIVDEILVYLLIWDDNSREGLVFMEEDVN